MANIIITLLLFLGNAILSLLYYKNKNAKIPCIISSIIAVICLIRLISLIL